MKKKLLTTSQAADLLGVDRQKVQQWERRGHLPARRHPLNNFRLFRQEDVEALAKKLEGV